MTISQVSSKRLNSKSLKSAMVLRVRVSGAGYAGKRGDEYWQQQAPGAYQNPGFDRRLPLGR
jgi:hypothetical protein